MNFQTNYSKQDAIWEVNLNGTKVLEYVYGAVEDPNPSFRLVKTLGGQTITLYRPWDHPWHPGLFFSWKYINGLNFWESMYHGKKNVAITDTFEPFNESGTGFEQSLSYVTYEGKTLLKEKRKVRIEEADSGYLIHWQGSFAPAVDEEITLDRTVKTEQAYWGGYAGLSCRLNRNFLGPVITTDQGVYTAEEAHTKPFRWCDYAGKLDGFIEPQWAGVCLMDHPSNERYPAPVLTYDYKDMQFLQAAFLFNEPYVLKYGETLNLRYTLYVHDGAAEKGKLERIWAQAAGLK